MRRVFVTGASGFVGQHFCRLVEAQDSWRVDAAPAELDLRDAASIAQVLHSLGGSPDAVLHLAAQSNVPQAFADPEATLDINFLGTLRLLRALQASGFRGRFIFVGTADAYGAVGDADLPVRETHPLRPRNPYAVSKTAAEALVYQWSQTEGLDAIMVRPFNHIGPGQDDRFAVGAFARQIAEIALGRRAPRIDIGDIEISRDFCDVRDVVRAYYALLTRGERGSVYNVGSGSETRLDYLLNRLLRIAGVDAELVVDPQRLRRSEQRLMYADIRLLRDAVGWQPTVTLDQTLQDTLNYWKDRLKHE